MWNTGCGGRESYDYDDDDDDVDNMTMVMKTMMSKIMMMMMKIFTVYMENRGCRESLTS